MQASKILVPTDFSESSEAALRQATSLARDQGAVLLIAHAKEPSVAAADTVFASYTVLHDDATLQQMLDEVTPPDPDVTCRRKLLTGPPANAIIRLAEQEGVDMIVMGTHGRTGLMRFVMGSVAESVVRRAKCPVLTVKRPHETPTKAGA